MCKPKLVSCTGEDAAQKIVEMLQEDIREISNKPMKEMIFGEEERVCYNTASKCWICGEGRFTSKNPKTRDHCHFTGRFRGTAHSLYNLTYRKPNLTPVLFHNLMTVIYL